MLSVYLMVPLMQVSCPEIIESEAEKLLKISNFQVHSISQEVYCVEVDNFNLSFLQIERTFQEYAENKAKLQLIEDVIANYTPKDHLKSDFQESFNIQSLMRKAKKSKELKEQNKKLKKMLQAQLQNTQKVRQQTQKTMKILKEQFDALVQQMNQREIQQIGKKSLRKNKDRQFSKKIDRKQELLSS